MLKFSDFMMEMNYKIIQNLCTSYVYVVQISIFHIYGIIHTPMVFYVHCIDILKCYACINIDISIY